MKKFSLIIEQVDHCKNLILDDSIPNLRMALILLDNATEIIMYRTVLDELWHNDLYSRILNKAKRELSNEKLAEFREKVDIPKILSDSKKKKILRYFDEKVKFLWNKGYFDQSLGSVAISLHKFRNETFHRDIVRYEILHSLSILFFEVVCIFILKLRINPSEYDFEDKWDDFYQKFGIEDKPLPFFNEDIVENIVSKFRGELNIDFEIFRENLVVYLRNKLNEVLKNLRFVNECIGLKNDKAVFEFILESFLPETEFRKDQLVFEIFASIDKPIDEIEKADDQIDLFNRFMEIEEKFSPFESLINHAAYKFDEAIQFQIDLARGK